MNHWYDVYANPDIESDETVEAKFAQEMQDEIDEEIRNRVISW